MCDMPKTCAISASGPFSARAPSRIIAVTSGILLIATATIAAVSFSPIHKKHSTITTSAGRFRKKHQPRIKPAVQPGHQPHQYPKHQPQRHRGQESQRDTPQRCAKMRPEHARQSLGPKTGQHDLRTR